MGFICALLTIYLVLLAVRAVLSWFPPQRSGSAIAQISNVIFEVTEIGRAHV